MSETTPALYHRIRALVLRDIRNAMAGFTPFGGLNATNVEGHTHDDRYYTETQSDTKFLDVSGDNITGNITVDPGVTIDGVDISAHVAATGTSVHGLGSMSTQSSSSVSITGGTITGITDLAVADGGTGASTASGARTNLGLVIGTNVQAWDTDLDTIAGLAKTDGNFIVGDGAAWVAESGATARTSLGLGTGDSPQFTAIELGHATDTTIARVSAGLISVEGVTVTLNTATQTLTNKTISADSNNLSGIAASSFVLSNASGNIDGSAAQKAIPAGVVVGTTDSQTLTNKTISADDNTLSGIAASSFVLSNASGYIDGAAAQKAIPSGVVVGTTDTQTLTNKTLTSPIVSNLTASRLVYGDGSKVLQSVSNLASWVAGTANRVTVTDDLDGTITLSGPQDLATTSTPQFLRLGVGAAAHATNALTVNGHGTITSLDVDGALTVDDDVTVSYAGYYPLYVNVNTSTPSASNVGIMTNAPDAQFALDVAGPLRAEVLVGPHAIQLDEAVMIVHFDGPTPYETNFDGFSTGHMGQPGTESGGVIYRPGKFGKAVQIAEATTNLIANPSFETDTSNWSVSNSGGSAGAIAQVTTDSMFGSACGSFTFTTVVGTYPRLQCASVATAIATNEYVTLSFWYKLISGTSFVASMLIDGSTVGATTITPASTGEWYRATVTYQYTGAGGTLQLAYFRSGTSGTVVYIDGVQMEKKAYATPYCDGTLGDGHSWSGTAHASTSARTVAILSYPTTGFPITGGTVMAWVKTTYLQSSSVYNTVWRMLGTTSGNVILRLYASGGTGYIQGYWGTAAVTGSAAGVVVDEWIHVAMTYSGTTLTLYVNGVAINSGTSSGFSGLPSTANIGSSSTGLYPMNGYIDELVLLDSALDADKLRAIYESEAPVFAESSVFSFRAPSISPVWVDEEGLWMRSASGNATLGIYGATATKSWGGLTMYDSDLVIGNSTAGYIHWHSGVDSDDTTYSGSPLLEIDAKLSVNGSLTAAAGSVQYFYVDDTGYIYAGNRTGSGALEDPNAAFGIDPDGNVFMGDLGNANMYFDVTAGQLKFRDGTTVQAYIDTDGSFVSGDGGIKISASGGVRVQTSASAYLGLVFVNTDTGTRPQLYAGGVSAWSDTSGDLARSAYYVTHLDNQSNPCRIELQAGTSSNTIVVNGITDYTDTMGNSTKNPATDSAADWIEVKIAGTTRYIPVYAA